MDSEKKAKGRIELIMRKEQHIFDRSREEIVVF